MSLARTALVLSWLTLVAARQLFAIYVDPSLSGAWYQALFVLVSGGLLFLARIKAAVLGFFRRLTGRQRPSPAADDGPSGLVR